MNNSNRFVSLHYGTILVNVSRGSAHVLYTRKERDYVLFAVTSHLRHSTLKLELNTSFNHTPFCKLMPRKCGTNIFAKKKHKKLLSINKQRGYIQVFVLQN